MYLSKVCLDWPSARTPYEWHRALWKLFPRRRDAARCFLFDIQEMRRGVGATVLMQSIDEPTANRDAPELLAAPKRFDLSCVAKGDRLGFRLRANVVKTTRDAAQPERPVRVPLIREDQQLAWLTRQLDGAGEFSDVAITPNEPLFFRRNGQAGKIASVTFNGVMAAVDPSALEEQMKKGVGHAKAFGCGLLLIRPLG